MKFKMFSVRDQKGQIFNTPFYKNNERDARYDFQRLVNDEKSLPGQYPDDFDLYILGEYDDQTGLTSSLDTPQHIEKAVNVRVQKPQENGENLQ